jgi:flagellar hook protein FlgE
VLRSLFSGITGLRAHQTLMDVVSNNISNVNTTGFKTSTAVFEDTLSQTMRNSNMRQAGRHLDQLRSGLGPEHRQGHRPDDPG